MSILVISESEVVRHHNLPSVCEWSSSNCSSDTQIPKTRMID